MPLKVKKEQLDIEFTTKYNTYGYYLKRLQELYPELSQTKIDFFFNENFNILNQEGLEHSLSSEYHHTEIVKSLLNLENDLKESLLGYISGVPTTTTLTKKKLSGSMTIFKKMIEKNSQELKKIRFVNEIISDDKLAYFYKGELYYEEEKQMLKITTWNGRVKHVGKKNLDKQSNEVKKLSVKIHKDGKKTYIENRYDNSYIQLGINKYKSITKEQLETNRKQNGYYVANQSQMNVTLYDKAIKDIRIVIDRMENNKSFPMKDYLGILKMIDFISKDILLDKNYGLVASIPTTKIFNADDNQMSLVDVYSNMIYGQGFEILNMLKYQLETPNIQLKNYDIEEWNLYVKEIHYEARKKGIKITDNSDLPSVDVIANEITSGKTKITLYEDKHFRQGYGNKFKVSQKMPRKIISKMQRLIDFTSEIKKVRATGNQEVTCQSMYDISTYNKKGEVSTALINMGDYIKFFTVVGEKIQLAYQSLDKKGHQKYLQNSNTESVNIQIEDIEILVKIERKQTNTSQKLDLTSNNIMDKSSKGVVGIEFLYKNNKDFIKILESFGATVNYAHQRPEQIIKLSNTVKTNQ